MKPIPLDQLQAKTSLGFQVKSFYPDESFDKKAKDLGAHRDDHYLFFLLKRGNGSLTIDWQQVNMGAGQLFYILPAQVHHHIRTRAAEGWFLAVDTSMVPPECRDVFEGKLDLQLPCTLNPTLLRQFTSLLTVLQQRYAENNNARLRIPAMHALLQSFVTMAAGSYDDVPATNQLLSRPAELCRQFKRLMAENIRTIKSPATYSNRLNVSLSYLNQSVKSMTGLPVRYWIQQEILVEAKRLLYHTQFNVKQIAYELGYEDAAYFSRFFRRSAGMSALAFRATLSRPRSKNLTQN
jgi:AraC-like DNA-binding protein